MLHLKLTCLYKSIILNNEAHFVSEHQYSILTKITVTVIQYLVFKDLNDSNSYVLNQ